jgi:DNA invertase Pin-like site-specific DNA recombinase
MKNLIYKLFVWPLLSNKSKKDLRNYAFNPAIENLNLSSKSHSEIAEEYNVTVRTMHRWIRKAGLDIPRGRIDPYHLKIIYQAFGTPKTMRQN